MIIKPITGGMYDSISYLVGAGKKAVLIDAGVRSEKVFAAAREADLTIEKVILTHGHIDHIIELNDIIKGTNAMVYIHTDDENALKDARFNLSAFAGRAFSYQGKYEVLRDGGRIQLEDLELRIIHTPGHTAGSICIEVNNTLFSGDTLFRFGYGRVDFPNGSFEDIYRSIVNKLFALPDGMVVYPGHGNSTTIELEKRANPIKSAAQW
ncbi:glyoxylase-like metal-dependent hydrolase (beta-lactamase superfamily II) [Ruminiclostridium sufflavum DSM 19573]|uniref:Glyoxylase-like metal-dependent hydrolase (Beta-lactamase superfamily II) n=1 Tax=Ruminiclostridium sufflavum DSM 19573 TaxID=1121337 RepID=A0A318XN87_9FIRM|nr:MBL fold metallo-hydrolase [Ruminiclostridium sufflavum]PYG87421.1 glyoxylase-like metal-dependent hydrolase (beta-lactamase superfamily II) [Ruminiclostridium sufflavum DSM 19573]